MLEGHLKLKYFDAILPHTTQKSMLRRLILILLTTFSGIHANAQPQELPLIFQSFGLENGLYNALINDVILVKGTDRYFATEGNGLMHFQQGRFFYYGLPEGLQFPFISTLCILNDDTLLLGSEHQVFYFTTRTKSFHLLHNFPVHIKVRKILTNRTKIFILSNEDKLYIINKNTEPTILKEIKLSPPAKIISWNDRILVAKDDTCIYEFKNNTFEIFYTTRSNILNVGILSERLLIFTDQNIIKIQNSESEIIPYSQRIQFIKNLVGNKQFLLGRVNDNKLIAVDTSGEIKFISIPKETNKFFLLDNGELWMSEGNRVKCYLFPSVDPISDFSKNKISKVYDLKTNGSRLIISAGSNVFSIDLQTNQYREVPINQNIGLVLQILKVNGRILLNTEDGLFRYNDLTLTPYSYLHGKYIGNINAYSSGCISFQDNTKILIKCDKKDKTIDFHSAILSHHWTDTNSLWIQTESSLDYYMISDLHPKRVATYKITPNVLISKDEGASKIWVIDDGVIQIFQDTTYKIFKSPTVQLDKIIKLRNIGEDTLIIIGDKIQMAYLKNNTINLTTLNYLKWINGTDQLLDFFKYGSQIFSISSRSVLKISNNLFTNYSNPTILLYRTMVNGIERNIPENVILKSNENTLHISFATTSDIFSEREYRYRFIIESDKFKNDTIDSSLPELYLANIYPAKYTLIYELISPENTVVDRGKMSFTISLPLWQRWWLISSIFVVFLLGSITFIRWRTNQLQEKVKLREMLVETETKALRLQMNPHFLYNSLESIEGFILNSDKISAIRHLNNFTRLMRLILEGSDKGIHSLKREKEILEYYLELEKMRASNAFDFEIKILPSDADTDNLFLPSMMIQPHVENAIIHGIRPLKNRKGYIQIIFTINKQMDEVEVLIEDNGAGRSKSSEFSVKNDVKSKSMALNINTQRLKIMSKTYKKTFLISIEDLFDDFGVPSGTRVRMNLPIIKNTEVC